MEAAVERRATPGSRVRFEAPVELDRGTEQHPIFADAINVSMGGLTMRSSSLPDLGQHLTCRFSAEMGDPIEIPAEVVWTREGAGEYGVKFLQLDHQSERSLRSRVLGAYVPPPISEPPPALETGCRRIVFHGVKDPVTVKVLHEDAGGLTIEQELPFLSLDTSIVTEEGRAGRIETVELVVDRGVPRMIVDLAYDEPLQIADATIPDEGLEWLNRGALSSTVNANGTLPGVGPLTMTPSGPRLAAHSPTLQEFCSPDPLSKGAGFETGVPEEPHESVVDAPSADDREITVSFETVTGRVAAESPVTEPGMTMAEALATEPASPAMDTRGEDERLAESVEPLDETTPGTLDPERSTEAVAFAADGEPDVTHTKATEAAPAVAQEPLDALMELPTGIWRSLRRLKDWVVGNVMLREMVAAIRNWWMAAAWPFLVMALRNLTAGASTLTKRSIAAGKNRLKANHERKAPQRAVRRQSSQAPAARGAAAVHPKKLKIGRWVLGAVLLGVGVFLLFKTVPSSVPAAPEPTTAAPQEAPAELLVDARQAPANEATASRNSGLELEHIAEGSPYAARSEELPAQAVPSEVEANANSAEHGPAPLFGEVAVDNGQTFVLRMSQTVSGVVGTDLEDGFKVVIPGSLSHDRAGPIARSHELVERSMILNHGDHSELTVRFVANTHPRYRVRARGSSIEVTIEQRS